MMVLQRIEGCSDRKAAERSAFDARAGRTAAAGRGVRPVHRGRPRTLTTAEHEQIRALAADLPAVWHAPATTDADLKQLIRHLVEQVRITVPGTSEKAGVEVTWARGHRTSAQITRPVACLAQLSCYPQLAARARELAGAGCTVAQIAGHLNAEVPPAQGAARFHPERGQRPAAGSGPPALPRPGQP